MGSNRLSLSKRQTALVSLSLLTLVALILRGYMVDQFILHTDEANRLRIASLDSQFLSWLRWDLTVRMQKRAHSSLYLILTRFFVYTGLSPVLSIRLPSVILGTLTVPAVYVLYKEPSRKEGLLVAGLLAVLPYHVFYSRLGWHVAAMTLCFVMSLACLRYGYFSRSSSKILPLGIGGYEPTRSDVYLFLSGLWFFAGYLFHETILAMLVPAGGYIIADQYRNWDRRLVILSGSLVPFLVFYSKWPLHEILARQEKEEFAVDSSLQSFVVDKAVQSQENLMLLLNLSNDTPVFSGRSLGAYLTFPVLALSLVGIWYVVDRRNRFESFLLVLLFLYPPIISFLHFGAHKPRFYLITVPIFAFLATRGLLEVLDELSYVSGPERESIVAISFVLILLFVSVNTMLVPVSESGRVDDINRVYYSGLHAGSDIEGFYLRNTNETGSTKISIIGGYQPRYHLWSHRTEIRYVPLEQEPDIVLSQPWVIRPEQEDLLEQCYEGEFNTHGWNGYVRTGCRRSTGDS